jgi:hypothetical protein
VLAVLDGMEARLGGVVERLAGALDPARIAVEFMHRAGVDPQNGVAERGA